MSENVREVLELAFFDIFGREPDRVHIPEWNQWRDREIRFKRFLDAEAYTDAALMLVPEGYDWSIDNFDGELVKSSAWICNEGSFFNGTGDTPAIAIAISALAAKGTGDE